MYDWIDPDRSQPLRLSWWKHGLIWYETGLFTVIMVAITTNHGVTVLENWHHCFLLSVSNGSLQSERKWSFIHTDNLWCSDNVILVSFMSSWKRLSFHCQNCWISYPRKSSKFPEHAAFPIPGNLLWISFTGKSRNRYKEFPSWKPIEDFPCISCGFTCWETQEYWQCSLLSICFYFIQLVIL